MKSVDEKTGVEGDEKGHFEASHVPGPDSGVAIAATLQDAKAVPNPWAWGHIQLYLICGIVYLCSTMNGEFHHFRICVIKN